MSRMFTIHIIYMRFTALVHRQCLYRNNDDGDDNEVFMRIVEFVRRFVFGLARANRTRTKNLKLSVAT